MLTAENRLTVSPLGPEIFTRCSLSLQYPFPWLVCDPWVLEASISCSLQNTPSASCLGQRVWQGLSASCAVFQPRLLFPFWPHTLDFSGTLCGPRPRPLQAGTSTFCVDTGCPAFSGALSQVPPSHLRSSFHIFLSVTSAAMFLPVLSLWILAF